MMELKETGWPTIELGYGLIEVAEGSQGDKPALIFGRNGTGKIGESTPPNRIATHEETLAVVTFANVESLDVVVGKLLQLRAELDALKAHEPIGTVSETWAHWPERGNVPAVDWANDTPPPVGTKLYAGAAPQAPAPKQADDMGLHAEMAGIQTANMHLSALVDELRASLQEMTDAFKYDGMGCEYEDGEVPIIDRARSLLEMVAAPQAPAPMTDEQVISFAWQVLNRGNTEDSIETRLIAFKAAHGITEAQG